MASAPKNINFVSDYMPHYGQMLFHLSRARFKILCCGRRFGKTKAAAQEAFFNIFPPGEVAHKKTRGWIVAPTYALTRELEREFRPLMAPLIETEIKDEHRYILVTGDEIEFKSADSTNLIGAGLDWLVIDEAARVPEIVWQECLRPCLTDKLGRAIIISSPKGRNWFWDAFQKGQDKENFLEYESWNFPSWFNPYLSKDEIRKAKAELPDLVFRQEYGAEFLNDATQFFKGIEACFSGEDKFAVIQPNRFKCPECDHYFRFEGVKSGMQLRCPCCLERFNYYSEAAGVFYSIGVDLAKSIDFTVITVLRFSEGTTPRIVYLERFNDLSWETQKGRIKSVYEKYGGTVYTDKTGLGDPILENLLLEGISCQGILFTNKSKSDMMNKLSIDIQEERLEIPWKDPLTEEGKNSNKGSKEEQMFEVLPVLISELQQFEATQTTAGNWKYSAPPGKHDDCVVSLALANLGVSIYKEQVKA